jgi:4-hydroxythreonine-4-phosphate dehydrogenase
MIPRIGLTLGDPAGIGAEVVLKSLRLVNTKYVPLIIGSAALVERAGQMLGHTVQVKTVKSLGGISGEMNVYDCGELDVASIRLGQDSKESGRVSYLWVAEAVKLALSRTVDAIVTAPISKSSWKMAGHDFPGHTDLLASLCHTDDYGMMMISGDLKLLLVTTHIPLEEVPGSIGRSEIEKKICLAHKSLETLFGISNPRVAVCSLNPHKGERGVLGREEIEQIEPAVRRCQSKRIQVEGPFSSDTLFLRRRHYDCIIAMYHDQGLIPFKLLSFGKGVNLTLGLPFIRTSPDHGTAYEIAGKGVADPSSMVAAIHLACELAGKQNQA